MRIKYYGTAAAEGWPALFCGCDACREAARRGGKNIRTRSQAAIDGKLLIDFPPDTYLHMLFYGLDLPSFSHCIVTHAHEDHLYPQDVAMRAHGFSAVVKPGRFTLHGPDAVCGVLDALPGWAKDDERIAWQEAFEYVPFEVEGYTVTPLLAAHGQFDAPARKCFIYDIEKDGERLLYGNDTAVFPEATWEAMRGRHYDLVSLDCTMLALGPGQTHMNIGDVLSVRDRLVAMGSADGGTVWVINHFSHNGGLLHEELEEIMRPEGFRVAWDGFEIGTGEK